MNKKLFVLTMMVPIFVSLTTYGDESKQEELVFGPCASEEASLDIKNKITGLLNSGADINGQSFYEVDAWNKKLKVPTTCLIELAKRGNVELMKFVIKEKNASAILKTTPRSFMGYPSPITAFEGVDKYAGSKVDYQEEEGRNTERVKKIKQMIYLLTSRAISEFKERKLPVDTPLLDDKEDRETLLFKAVFYGSSETVSLLLENGANPNQGDDGSRFAGTPLLNAALYGHFEIVRRLVEAGADVNFKRKGDGLVTALETACWYRFTNIALYLIEQGAEIVGSSSESQTPLHYAASAKDSDVIKALLLKGAKIDVLYVDRVRHGMDDGKIRARITPLINAISSLNPVGTEEDQVETVRLLLERGADPNFGDQDGLTPLGLAKAYKKSEIAELLLQYGANPEKLKKD